MGATFARLAHTAGKRCLVVEKRDHTGGNVYCREVGAYSTDVRLRTSRNRL